MWLFIDILDIYVFLEFDGFRMWVVSVCSFLTLFLNGILKIFEGAQIWFLVFVRRIFGGFEEFMCGSVSCSNVKFTIINRVTVIKFRRTSLGHQYYKQYKTVGAPKPRFLG